LSTNDAIIERESDRLRNLSIPFEHIHIADGVPVVTVSKDTLDGIVAARNNGIFIDGRFICCSDGSWSASYLPEPEMHSFKDGMSEQLAYRFVLGYRVGRGQQTSRYKGYSPKYRLKKDLP